VWPLTIFDNAVCFRTCSRGTCIFCKGTGEEVDTYKYVLAKVKARRELQRRPSCHLSQLHMNRDMLIVVVHSVSCCGGMLCPFLCYAEACYAMLCAFLC
jgi:hypothetical protein